MLSIAFSPGAQKSDGGAQEPQFMAGHKTAQMQAVAMNPSATEWSHDTFPV
jgi:hypothetical protein